MTGFADEFYEDHVEAMMADQHELLNRWRAIADELADQHYRRTPLPEPAKAALRRYEEARDE